MRTIVLTALVTGILISGLFAVVNSNKATEIKVYAGQDNYIQCDSVVLKGGKLHTWYNGSETVVYNKNINFVMK